MFRNQKEFPYDYQILDITLLFCYFLVMKITIFKTRGYN